MLLTDHSTAPIGNKPLEIEINFASMLEVAGTVDEIVSAVSADIDSGVCEKIRKWNEAAKKAVSRPTTTSRP